MKEIVTRFFSLLRCGLWATKVDVQLFETCSPGVWEELYHMAASQALLAVVFDGVSTLPETLRPPRQLYLQWARITLQVESQNERLNGVMKEVVQYYATAKIITLVLKGQGVASYYPCPEHRQCGDIDLYPIDGFERANNLIASLDIPFQPESEKHLSFVYKGIQVENHYVISKLHSPKADRLLARFLKEEVANHTCMRRIGEETFLTPSPNMNALFLLIHACNHFFTSGIGLRQVCDWSMILQSSQREIDLLILRQNLQRMGLLRTAQAFGYIAVHYLGLPAYCLPLNTNEAKYGEKLLEDILEGGNFATYRKGVGSRPEGKWWGKVYTCNRLVKRCLLFRSFCPTEAFWYPIILTRNRVALFVKGKL